MYFDAKRKRIFVVFIRVILWLQILEQLLRHDFHAS